MRATILALVIVAIVVGGLGAEYFAGAKGGTVSSTTVSNGASSTTLSSTTTATFAANSTSSAQKGLELKASISPMELDVSQSPQVQPELLITISLSNSLPEALDLSTGASSPDLSFAGSFKVPGFPVAMWGACLGQEPVDFMVVKGNFTIGQLQQASVNAPTPPIICMEGGNVETITFQPKGSNATLSGDFCTAQCAQHSWEYNLSSTFAINGYWAYPLNSSEANDVLTQTPGAICQPGPCLTYNYPEVGPTAQHIFTAGWYTLVVSDAWGQTDVMQFDAVS